MPNFNLEPEVFRAAAVQFPTPFHLYDERGIRETARDLKNAFSWNSSFREYYAVKALPNPIILRILKDEGCGVDCASLAELVLSHRVGFNGADIMFSSNDTPAEEYVYARQLNALINLDDISHIDFLAKNGGIPETICCRYNPGSDFYIGNAIMGSPRDAKYGMTRPQLTQAFLKLKELGAKRFGLHAFLASNTTESEYYPILAHTLFETAVQLQAETGVAIGFINLSGGIGIPYYPDQPQADIALIGRGVKAAFEQTMIPAGLGHVSILTELGRYMTGPHGWLVTHAIHEKRTHKRYIGLDACAANLMRPAIYGAYHHITVVGKEDAPCDRRYDVVGSLCENNDKFAVDRDLPRIKRGDLVVLHDTGAHGSSMGYNYNGKLQCAEVLYQTDGTFRLIRRAQTLEDYFAPMIFE